MDGLRSCEAETLATLPIRAQRLQISYNPSIQLLSTIHRPSSIVHRSPVFYPPTPPPSSSSLPSESVTLTSRSVKTDYPGNLVALHGSSASHLPPSSSLHRRTAALRVAFQNNRLVIRTGYSRADVQNYQSYQKIDKAPLLPGPSFHEYADASHCRSSALDATTWLS